MSIARTYSCWIKNYFFRRNWDINSLHIVLLKNRWARTEGWWTIGLDIIVHGVRPLLSEWVEGEKMVYSIFLLNHLLIGSQTTHILVSKLKTQFIVSELGVCQPGLLPSAAIPVTPSWQLVALKRKGSSEWCGSGGWAFEHLKDWFARVNAFSTLLVVGIR